jgi:hypothetical protein
LDSWSNELYQHHQREKLMADTMAPPLLLRQLLEWVAFCPRRYAEALEAWSTDCPGLAAWEDAAEARLVKVRPSGDGLGAAWVELTDAGRRALLG